LIYFVHQQTGEPLLVSLSDQIRIQEIIQQCLDTVLGEDTAKYFKIIVEFKSGIKTAAGLAYQAEHRIVLNEALFLNNKEEFFNQIIPHEVAHILQYVLYPAEKLHHGRRWKGIMLQLGLSPSVYHDLDVSAVDEKVHRYTCNCQGGLFYHQIIDTMHKRLQRSGRSKICGRCQTRIIHFPRGD
jgi:SprT protein